MPVAPSPRPCSSGNLVRSPTEHVQKYRITTPLIRTLTREEIRALIDGEPETAGKIRNRTIVALMYDTGIRVGELARLHVADVDLIAGRIVITGKNRSIDGAALSPACTRSCGRISIACDPPELFPGSAPLFGTQRGRGRVSENAVRQWMRRAKIAAGIEPARSVSPHRIRERSDASGGERRDRVSRSRLPPSKGRDMSRLYVKLAELELDRPRQHDADSPFQRLRGAS